MYSLGNVKHRISTGRLTSSCLKRPLVSEVFLSLPAVKSQVSLSNEVLGKTEAVLEFNKHSNIALNV